MCRYFIYWVSFTSSEERWAGFYVKPNAAFFSEAWLLCFGGNAQFLVLMVSYRQPEFRFVSVVKARIYGSAARVSTRTTCLPSNSSSVVVCDGAASPNTRAVVLACLRPLWEYRNHQPQGLPEEWAKMLPEGTTVQTTAPSSLSPKHQKRNSHIAAPVRFEMREDGEQGTAVKVERREELRAQESGSFLGAPALPACLACLPAFLPFVLTSCSINLNIVARGAGTLLMIDRSPNR